MFRFAGGGAFLLGSGFWFLNAPPPPTVYVNENNEMLSAWPSEAMGAPSSMPPECSFFDFAVRFDATLCSHFTIARVASVPAQAMRRALRCAGAYGAECILSPEVGLGLPAAFLYSHETQRMRMLIAPKPVPLSAEEANATDPAARYVRVAAPDGDGLLNTYTQLYNATVAVEYLDGERRALEREVLVDESAYCVQLLRDAFEPSCWAALD